MMSKKTLLITGVAGFIGSHFTRRCLKLGYNVIGVDSMTYASNEKFIEEFDKYPNFVFHRRDINDISLFGDIDIDYIINFAAESHVDRSITCAKDFIHSNINGVHNLLEQIIDTNTILIQISTDEVFGDIEEGSHKEWDKLNPSNPYAATKASADLLIDSYRRTHDIRYKIIRLTNNYGPDQNEEKLIPKTIKYLQQGKKLPLHNNGTPKRNWLYVSDSVEAILKVIEEGNINEIYNVNGNCELENRQVVTQILSVILDKAAEQRGETYYTLVLNDYVDFGYDRKGQDIRYSLEDSKLRRLGWAPKADFQEKLEEIVKTSMNSVGSRI